MSRGDSPSRPTAELGAAVVATVVGTSSACVLSRRRRMAGVIVATPGWELPTTSERQSYLLIVLPKLKTSISSAVKRTIMATHCESSGVGNEGIRLACRYPARGA